MVSATEPGKTTLAEKIDKLFRIVLRPDRECYSHEEVATACREATGESFSTTYLWQLRTGRRDNPTKRHLEALAQFFGVSRPTSSTTSRARRSPRNSRCSEPCATRVSGTSPSER